MENTLNNTTIEFHIVQTYPVNCLNRGENGELKTCVIGGTTRQRFSSQCWKHAVRQELAKNESGKRVIGSQLKEMFEKSLAAHGCSQKNIVNLIFKILKSYGILEKDLNSEDSKDKILVFASNEEIENIAIALSENNWKFDKNIVLEVGKKTKFEDDIALFGRMVAGKKENEKDKDNAVAESIEAATSFNHPYTVHKITVDSDFYTALADNPPKPGAINMGNQDFAAGTFYKYFSVNLDTLLKNKKNDIEAVKKIVNWDFLKKICIANPAAHGHDKNASTRPSYVCMVIRKNDAPQQVIFDKSINPKNDKTIADLAAEKIEKDINEWKNEETVYSFDMSKFNEMLAKLF